MGKDRKDEIVKISSDNTDYYAWGKNCALLKYDQETTESCLSVERYINPDDEDIFWVGYFDNYYLMK